MATGNRPLSPHLDVYKWRITMLTSTLHRLSGLLVSLGMFVLVIRLASIAAGGESGFETTDFLTSLFWFIWTLAIYYHLCNGIRHLVWDSGRGLAVQTVEKTAKFAFIGAAVLALLTWLIF